MMAGMFPRHIIEFIGSHCGTSSVPENVAHLARSHEDISVLFLDIVGFTSMAKEADPQDVMLMLNKLFSVFDQLCLSHGVHKVRDTLASLAIPCLLCHIKIVNAYIRNNMKYR